MPECKLCQAGDPSVTVICWDCKGIFHIHRSQYGELPEGTFIMGDCPSCGIVNCWQKGITGVITSDPVLYYGQPILDLREKR